MGPLSDRTINASLLELPELGLCFLPSIDSLIGFHFINVGSVLWAVESKFSPYRVSWPSALHTGESQYVFGNVMIDLLISQWLILKQQQIL